MPSVNNKKLCDLCFEPLHSKGKRCDNCSGVPNTTKYPTSLPEGTILAGKYYVGKVLGKGGFGITYLCYDLKHDKRVAIKEYLPDSLAHRNHGETTVTTYGGEKDSQFKNGAQKFFEEAKLVSRFNGNPNIISVHEFFYENNTTYFVMEYLSGTDMKGYLKEKKKLSEAETIYIANRAIDALIIVHSTYTLHRDIAPDNIFICDDGSVKLIDFGAARNVIANESKSLSVILKHGFAPLEQYQSKGKQGPWTDIYALGVTLYFALTGEMPDDAMSRLDEPELDMTGISASFASILNKMMEVRADARYRDMVSVKRDIAALGIVEAKTAFARNERQNQSKEYDNIDNIIEEEKTIGDNFHTSNSLNSLSYSNEVETAEVFSFEQVAHEEVATEAISITERSSNGEKWSFKDGVLTICENVQSEDYEYDHQNGAFKSPWFDKREEIKTVIIKNGVTRIAIGEFSGCTSLNEVIIPESVSSINDMAFSSCKSLAHILIPYTVEKIGEYAFDSCTSLSKVVISNGVKIIENFAFYCCTGLKTIELPRSIKKVGYRAFDGCDNLKTVCLNRRKGAVKIENHAFPDHTQIIYLR